MSEDATPGLPRMGDFNAIMRGAMAAWVAEQGGGGQRPDPTVRLVFVPSPPFSLLRTMSWKTFGALVQPPKPRQIAYNFTDLDNVVMFYAIQHEWKSVRSCIALSRRMS